MSRLCFEGSAEELALTENTQPAVLTVSIAALAALERRGVRPAAAAGHSLGEYSAHVAAGTLDFEDAVRAVRARGQFMQQAVAVGQGAMAAILGLDRRTVSELCLRGAAGQVVEPVNFNEPAQTAIAGHAAAVERVMELARQAGAKRALRLPVSAPFHSSLMEPAARRLAAVLREIEFRDPRFPVYTNVAATPISRADAARETLLRQVASPVRWQELIEALVAAGIGTFVEVGPGRVLSGLVRRIHGAARVIGVADPSGVELATAELGAAA
jgi:[acyl-carrier-protein] S-malonyltransferase